MRIAVEYNKRKRDSRTDISFYRIKASDLKRFLTLINARIKNIEKIWSYKEVNIGGSFEGIKTIQ